MCGRYYIDDEVSQAIEQLVREIDESFGSSFRVGDIHPSESAPVLNAAQKGSGLQAMSCVWGFPGFDKRGVIFNARSETALEKKMFSSSVLTRRCVIPAVKFYEWDRAKNKVTFLRKDRDILYMAGFYDFREEENRFVILTTGANSSMLPVHDRMPLILERDQIEEWIRGKKPVKEMLSQQPGELEREFEFYQERMTCLFEPDGDGRQ